MELTRKEHELTKFDFILLLQKDNRGILFDVCKILYFDLTTIYNYVEVYLKTR